VTGAELISARYHAAACAENLFAAFWMEMQADGNTFKHLLAHSHHEFTQLAAAMGYTVAPIAAPVAEVAPTSNGLCGCCGTRPIAYSIAGECADCFSENEAAE
jgi:hypothetical protein